MRSAAGVTPDGVTPTGSMENSITNNVPEGVQLKNTIITMNVRGLFTKNFKEKVNILSDFANYSSTLFIILTESHLRPAIKDAEITIANYVLYRADRGNNRKKGGVAIYVRSDLAGSCTPLLVETNGQVECILLYNKKLNLVVGGVYRPPPSQMEEFSPTLKKLHDAIGRLGSPDPTIFLTGDFNFPNVNWASASIYGGSDSSRRQAEALINFTVDHNLEQQIKSATRGNNILDLLFTNNDQLIDDVKVEDTALSDHRLILLTTNIVIRKESAILNETRPPLQTLNFHNENVNWEVLNNYLMDHDWDTAFNGLNPDEMYDMFYQKIIKACQEHIPTKRKPISKKNIIPRHRRVLMRKRSRAVKKIGTARTDSVRERLKRKVVDIETKLASSHREQRNREEERAINVIKTNPKYFYTYARSKAEIKAVIGPFTQDGQIISDPQAKSNILMKQFQSVFSHPNPHDPEESDVVLPPNIIEDIDFNTEDLIKSIGSLNGTSAAGPDGIPAILLKKCSESLKYPLFLLWRASVNTGCVPKETKKGLITPIYKGGSRGSPQNYRPVALTSHLIKIFEKIIVNKLVDHLEKHNLFNKSRHGFRRGRSCLSQLLQHFHQIIEALARGECIDVIYLDFAKAFDKVDHAILLKKLRKIAVRGALYRWIRAFLIDRKQAVVVEGAQSVETDVISGVPQGSVLGPLLFLIHISDIDEEIAAATVSSFADDTRVMMRINSVQDRDALQADLAVIYKWAEENNMKFNGSKFEMMTYGTRNTNLLPYEASDGTEIKKSAQLRDLGIIMQDSASFEVQIQTMVSRARSQMGWVLRSFSTREQKAMLTLYKATVLPLLEYASQLWSPGAVGLIRMIEGVQRTFTSRIAGMKEMNYWQRLKHLKLYSLERRRDRYAVIYIFKNFKEMVPNIECGLLKIEFYEHLRRGRLCRIPGFIRGAKASVQTARENSFIIRASRLFNALPRELRNLNGTAEHFKQRLDKYLTVVPDQPLLPHYYQGAKANDLVSQCDDMRKSS